MSANKLRIIFAGTPEFAALHLDALLDSAHNIVAVYTQPDRPAGRGKKLQASPVKQRAVARGIPVLQPPSLKDPEVQKVLSDFEADVMVVVAYGLILPQAVLDAPRLGCINVHASLLPRWRGAAPIQRAIEAGDAKTGTSIMQMEAGLDTGPILAMAECHIESETTAAELHDTLASLGAPLLVSTLGSVEQHLRDAVTQDDSLACYAEKILKPEARIDWRESAEEIARKVAAFNPFPVCFTELGNDRLKLWRATAQPSANHEAPPGTLLASDNNGILIACGEGALLATELQLPGGRAMSSQDLLNARAQSFSPGQRLGNNAQQ